MNNKHNSLLTMAMTFVAIKVFGGTFREYFMRRELEAKAEYSADMADTLARHTLKELDEKINKTPIGSEKYFELMNERNILQYKINKRRK